MPLLFSVTTSVRVEWRGLPQTAPRLKRQGLLDAEGMIWDICRGKMGLQMVHSLFLLTSQLTRDPSQSTVAPLRVVSMNAGIHDIH
jgi:hypothetical protein